MAKLADLPTRQAGALTGDRFMDWFVYAIQSKQHKYIYVGLTSNLERRITQHNEGKERTTRPYRPFTLLHSETFGTRAEARKRKIYLKSGCGKEFIKTLPILLKERKT